MAENPKPPWKTVHGLVLGSGVPIRVEKFSGGLIITVPPDALEMDNAYSTQEFHVDPDYDLGENIDEIEDNFLNLVDDVRRNQAEMEGRGRSLN